MGGGAEPLPRRPTAFTSATLAADGSDTEDDEANRSRYLPTMEVDMVTIPDAPLRPMGPGDLIARATEMLASFDERRKIIHEELNAIPGFRCVMPKGAFYAFPNTSGTGIASKTLEHELLNEAGVACLSGASFGKFGEGYMRFSYANHAPKPRGLPIKS